MNKLLFVTPSVQRLPPSLRALSAEQQPLMGPGQRGSKKLLSCKTTHRTVACLLHDPPGAHLHNFWVYSCRSLSAVAYRSFKNFLPSLFLRFLYDEDGILLMHNLTPTGRTNVELLAVPRGAERSQVSS